MNNQAIAGMDVSRETIKKLEHFAGLLSKWTQRINLIAPGTVQDIWNRHIIDSAQLLQHIPENVDEWCDIGSGGGLPGMVIAIISQERMPKTTFTFIESDKRKCTFLRTAARETGLSVNIIAERIETAHPSQANIVSARALSSLSDLLPQLSRHLLPNGTALIHKGRRHAEEILSAQSNWRFEVTSYPSITDPDACILALKEIARA